MLNFPLFATSQMILNYLFIGEKSIISLKGHLISKQGCSPPQYLRILFRVARCVFEKIAQNVAQPVFVKLKK
jgi:hypothetical protein